MNARTTLFATIAVAALLLAGCTGKTAGGEANLNSANSADDGCSTGGDRLTIDQAGSSTVLPIAEAWAEEFGDCLNASIVVAGGGSSTGIAKFCKGEIDIGDASRPIKQSEIDTCRAAGIEPNEFTVAIDGLSVVVAKSNTFAQCLTVTQLYGIWTAVAEKQLNKWSDVNPSWPDEDIVLFGPGTDSGTYDYWKEAIIHPTDGSKASTRSDYTGSEDDNVIVGGVASNPYALGYFGLAYFEHNKDRLNAVKIDEGKGRGCIEPTPTNVESGAYSPLARPIFMYVDGTPQGVLKAYFEKGYSVQGQALVEEVGYIKLPAGKLVEMTMKLA